MIDIYSFEDRHMDAWRERLGEREQTWESSSAGMVFEWDYETMLEFLCTSEKTFKILNKERKEKLFEARGFKLLEMTGRGKNSKAKVLVTTEFSYNVMLRRYEAQRVRRMPAHNVDYLNMMVTGNGFLDQHGVLIIPVLMDVAENLADKHGLNADATHKSLKELRSALNKYGYVVTGKRSVQRHVDERYDHGGYYNGEIKMHRGYRSVKGANVRVVGPEAHFIGIQIKKLYREKYDALDKEFPLAGLTGKHREDMLSARSEILKGFKPSIEKKLGLSHIRTVYVTTGSIKAYVDKHAIMELLMLGATFPEIIDFMKEREDFWGAYDTMLQARNEAEKENPELREERIMAKVFGERVEPKVELKIEEDPQ